MSLRKTLASLFLAFAALIIFAANARADGPKLIECPDHTHVWDINQCPSNSGPFGFPGTGHGGSSSGGLLGLIHGLTGGLL